MGLVGGTSTDRDGGSPCLLFAPGIVISDLTIITHLEQVNGHALGSVNLGLKGIQVSRELGADDQQHLMVTGRWVDTQVLAEVCVHIQVLCISLGE